MGIRLSKVHMFRKFQSTLPTHIQDNQDHQKDLQLKDRISELPDDLFGIILSHLPIKEVARNSVISHRWRNLWKVTACLDLDSFKNEDPRISETDMLNYVKWVNHIVESHEGGKLQEFRICHGLDKYFEHDIDKWVRFAFSKQVQCFDLEVSATGNTVRRRQKYTLTYELVETFANHKFNGFKHLKSLSLKHLNIDDKLLEFILNSSPALEHLCIKGSHTLSTFRVSGPQCVLKCLELNGGFESLEINDVASLVSLTFSGPLPEKLIIKNVPSLTDFHFAGCMVAAFFNLKLNDLLAQFSCSLKSLTLDVSSYVTLRNYERLPKLAALEKLVVHTGNTNTYTSWFASLTRLCPSLKEFVFQAHFHDKIALPDGKLENFKYPHPHEFLKEVKILGYYGLTRDVEIALYFIRNAAALETIIIDPRDQSPFFFGTRPNTEIERDARIRAKKQLKWKVPARVKLVVL